MLAEIRAKKPFNGQRARLTVDGARPTYISNFNCAAVRVLMYLIIDSTPSYERWMNLQYILKFLKYIICIEFDYSVENKIIFFLNSLFLNSCSLKYYRQRGAAAATVDCEPCYPPPCTVLCM